MKDDRFCWFGLAIVCIGVLIEYNRLVEIVEGEAILGPKNVNMNSVIVLIE